MFGPLFRPAFVATLALAILGSWVPSARADVTREEVEKAIRDGVRFLIDSQRADGSWEDQDQKAHTGTTGLVTLALLTAGERPDSPAIARALNYLQRFSAVDLNSTYAVSLQTMVFAAADPQRFTLAINGNVAWLEKAQIQPGDRNDWPGTWSYELQKMSQGDNSNTQYALLALNAASEVGVPVKQTVWDLSRQYFEDSQRSDGGWGYYPRANDPTSGSMTCSGISSLIISGLKRYEGQEILRPNGRIDNCGKGGVNSHLQRGVDWLSGHFRVGQNYPKEQLWKFYYLYGLERAGRLSGLRYFGDNDWYRLGAEHLVHSDQRDRLQGFWSGGQATERSPLVSTSFALLFLAKGRSPVVINKMRHGPGNDWNNDRDDVRNLVNTVSKDWKHLLTWQVVDPDTATVEDLLQAPIAYITGHEAPIFTDQAKKALREYVEQGGFILGEACDSSPEFDAGFKALMEDLFPEREYELHPLPAEHPVWRANRELNPDVHPLWGIEHGCRTVVIYTPQDLSCYWNQAEAQPLHPFVIKALMVGQNIVDYATGRELPADKLAPRDLVKLPNEIPKRGALHVAKLKHAGDWNVAPLAVPNLTTMLRDKFKLDVVINHKELFPRDPNLVYYPLIYIHGRAGLSFGEEDMAALRRHLDPGGGTLFADAACGSPSFDASFRKFVADLLPNNPLVPIPPEDELYNLKGGYNLAAPPCQYSKAAGGGQDRPLLEGVKLDGHWAVIYSKYDIGCSLERQQGALDCKGYVHESAMRIAANIVLYATLPQ